MPARSGPLYVFEIAEALARQPGRSKTDPDEARRIAQEMFGQFQRGEFGEKEVIVQYGDPARFLTIAEARANRISHGRPWVEVDLNLWYAAVALTYPAAQRFIERCGLLGAKRLLDEWFAGRSRHKIPTHVRRRVVLRPGQRNPVEYNRVGIPVPNP